MEIILKYFSEFTPKQLDQLKGLDVLFKEWNEKINVISRKDIDGLYEKHVLHSLSIAAVFEFEPGTEIIDIGTGGGFPGIPLAIFFPEVKFHLVDSIAKKLKVVEAIARDAGIANVSVQHSRVEEIKNRKFDFVVSRAVAPLKDLWKWSKPLLKKNPKSEIRNQKISRLLHPEASGRQAGYRLSTIGSGLSTPKPGLICLKGGDLANEVGEAGLKPYITGIHSIFPEEYFREKFILYNPI